MMTRTSAADYARDGIFMEAARGRPVRLDFQFEGRLPPEHRAARHLESRGVYR